jgi:hypothetical protein
MADKIIHLVDHHLLFIVIWGKVGADELTVYDEKIIRILDEATVPLLHVIYDYTHAEALPSLKDLSTLKSGNHPKAGWLIFVGVPNPFIKFLVSVTVQVMRLRLRFFDTFEEAKQFIQEMDSTLPDLTSFDLKAMGDEARTETPS